MRIALALVLTVASLAACAKPQQTSAPPPVRADASASQRQATAPARNPEADREIARLRSQLQERNAQIADLQSQIVDAQRRLTEAMSEAVRAMARLRTLATRAEAASAMAEAEVTVQQVRQRSGHADLQEADRLLRSASVEFEAENYGGAVYLATQAKRVATSGAGGQ
jgi:chromosome segregation ATPase